MPSPLQSQAVIIGGGISGLACAYYLRKSGVSAVVLEQANRPGGMIRSSMEGGRFLLEEGPQSFLSNDALLEMICDVGLESEVVHADARAPRYVLLNGKLRRVPMHPPQLLSSSLLGLRTKFMLVRDALGRSMPPEPDESVAAFVRRKFTPELLDRLVGPFISGIFAGDPECLSLRAAFPAAYKAEKTAGSIIRGIAKLRSAEPGERKGAPRHVQKHSLISFRNGTDSLVKALSSYLGDNLICGATAQKLSYDLASRDSSASTVQFVIHATRSGHPLTFEAASLIVATAADAASQLLAPLSDAFTRILATIEYAPLAVISSIYRASQLQQPLHGFGFLVPRSENLRLLGTVWNTSLFPGRAPEGYTILTAFAGGATDPALATLSTQDVAELITKELALVLSIVGTPERSVVKIYTHALPQYNLGHVQRITSLRELGAKFAGLFLTGNYLEGPSIGACVQQAQRVALATQTFLSSSLEQASP